MKHVKYFSNVSNRYFELFHKFVKMVIHNPFQNPDRVEYLTGYALHLAHNGYLNAAKQFLYRAQFVLFCKRVLQTCSWQQNMAGRFPFRKDEQPSK